MNEYATVIEIWHSAETAAEADDQAEQFVERIKHAGQQLDGTIIQVEVNSTECTF